MDLSALALRWLLNAFALWVTSLLVPGIEAGSIGATLLAAAVLGVLNALLRPILLLLTLPITVVTLGLFALVINAAMLMLAASIVEGFVVSGFWAAFFGSIVLSIVSVMLSLFVGNPGGPRAQVHVVWWGTPPHRDGPDYPPHIRREPRRIHPAELDHDPDDDRR